MKFGKFFFGKKPRKGPGSGFLPPANTLIDRAFVDASVDLTGRHVENCAFDGCVVTLRADPASKIIGNTFRACSLVGEGWPQAVLVENRRVNPHG